MISSITNILNAIVEFFKPSAPAPTIVNPRLKSLLKNKPMLLAEKTATSSFFYDTEGTGEKAVVKLVV